MNFWRKSFILAIIASLALTGCSGGPANQTTETLGPVKFSISMSDALNKYMLNSPDINQSKWVKKLEELTNTDMDIKIVSHQEFKQKIALMFAGNDIPDVVNVLQSMTPLSPDMSGAVKAGLFMPLDDLLKQYGQDLLKAIPKEAWDEVKVDGKIYAIPEYLSVSSRRGTFIRKDLFEKTGLPIPKTVEEFLNVLRALKKNGVESPYAFRENFIYADVIFGAYDVMPYSGMFEKAGDQIVPKFLNADAMMKALQVYKTMYDEGLMAKDFASVTAANWTKNINTGISAVWNHNANGLQTWVTQVKQANPNADVMIIPSPVGPDGKGGMMNYSSTVRLSYVNSKVSKETAAGIVKFFNFMVSEQADKFFNFGIEGDTYKMENGKVVYNQPKNADETAEEVFRTSILRLVKDDAINRTLLGTTDQGKKVIQAFDTIVSKEGREGISFDPPLDAYSKYTDSALRFADIPPVLLDHMLKMVYGKEPISDWPKVIEEWKSKGGNDIMKEATDRYNKKQGVKIGADAKVK